MNYLKYFLSGTDEVFGPFNEVFAEHFDCEIVDNLPVIANELKSGIGK
jgi:hypothetical protein